MVLMFVCTSFENRANRLSSIRNGAYRYFAISRRTELLYVECKTKDLKDANRAFPALLPIWCPRNHLLGCNTSFSGFEWVRVASCTMSWCFLHAFTRRSNIESSGTVPRSQRCGGQNSIVWDTAGIAAVGGTPYWHSRAHLRQSFLTKSHMSGVRRGTVGS